MRVTREIYPIMDCIENWKNLKISKYDYNYFSNNKNFEETYKRTLESSRKNIMVVTKPFRDAYEKAHNHFEKFLIQDVRSENVHFSGVILNFKNQLVHDIIVDVIIERNGNMSGTVFGFRDGTLLLYASVKDKEMWASKPLVDTYLYKIGLKNNPFGTTGYVSVVLVEIMKFILFIKYAEVETKLLPPKSKQKDGKTKYKNEINSNVTILNSKWFTTLVKSDAFKVSGHFRLQPHGEGRKKRKLIWINEFEKSGYTAKAKKLMQ